MSIDRYVVLGLAHVRTAWFTEVARWSTAGSIPVEFVKCLSVEELRARVAGGRPFSAALVDGLLPTVDRDLLATLRGAGIPSLVVAGDAGTDWPALGATATLGAPLTNAILLDALATHARLVGLDDAPGPLDDPDPTTETPWRARLVVVSGRSGAGASTLAAAVAQGVADDPRYAGDVLLVDLARHARQALLHDARDVVPGIQEVVEAHRNRRPSAPELRRLTFDVPGRGYRLVLGLRRPHHWVSLRSRAFAAALDGLRRSARVVVADTDADLEGEEETGSVDVEERHLVARTATAQADLVLAVGTPSLSGLAGLVGQIEELRAHGVAGERILAVVNRAPRGARPRAELRRVIAELTGATERPDPHVGPAFVPERRHVDSLHRDLARFPGTIVDPVAGAVRELLDRLPSRTDAEAGPEPVPVAPGSLGRWADDQGAAP